MDNQQHKLEKYILHNEIADSYLNTTDATKQHLMNKAMDRSIGGSSKAIGGVVSVGGGAACANTKMNDGIYKWTMLKYTGNQNTMSKELRGGRVSFPLEYFGKDNGGYQGAVKTTKMSDITPGLARPGLASSMMGGDKKKATNIFSLTDLGIMHGGHTHDLKLSNKKQYELLKDYNSNVKLFLQEVNELTGGQGRSITKKNINAAYNKVKLMLK